MKIAQYILLGILAGYGLGSIPFDVVRALKARATDAELEREIAKANKEIERARDAVRLYAHGSTEFHQRLVRAALIPETEDQRWELYRFAAAIMDHPAPFSYTFRNGVGELETFTAVLSRADESQFDFEIHSVEEFAHVIAETGVSD